MNRVKKLVGGILAITLCVSVSAQTKLPPGLAIQLCENYSERGVNLLSR